MDIFLAAVVILLNVYEYHWLWEHVGRHPYMVANTHFTLEQRAGVQKLHPLVCLEYLS